MKFKILLAFSLALWSNLSRPEDYSQWPEDCPQLIRQGFLTTAARIVALYKNNFTLKKKSQHCATPYLQDFENAVTQSKASFMWTYRYCFYHSALREEKCFSVIPFLANDNPKSESQIIEKIIKKKNSSLKISGCQLISQQEYTPYLLKHQYGCFITYHREKCHAFSCEKKLFINNQERNFFTVRPQKSYPFFTLSHLKKKYSWHDALQKILQKKAEPLENFDELKFFLLKGKRLVYGVGCGEDMQSFTLPRQSLNQCTLFSFLISGLQGQKIIVHLDDRSIKKPLYISWTELYRSVKNYKKIHPLNMGTLYGLP